MDNSCDYCIHNCVCRISFSFENLIFDAAKMFYKHSPDENKPDAISVQQKRIQDSLATHGLKDKIQKEFDTFLAGFCTLYAEKGKSNEST